MSYADRLGRMDDAYQQAEAGGYVRGFPPDGQYQCVIDRFDFIEAKKDGELFLKTELTVAIGEQKGHPIELIHSLENQKRLGMLKDHLLALGLELESLAQLELKLPEAIDAVVLVEVWTSKKQDANGVNFRNAQVRQRIGALSEFQAETRIPTGTVMSDADIPF